MSVYLGQLYHWSPKERRESILQHGLMLMADPQIHSTKFPWICLGTTPSSAWPLTLAEDRMEHEVWDLWQVTLRDSDHVEVLQTYGPLLREVRVHNGLPSDRLWWCGEREIHAGMSIQKAAKAKAKKKVARALRQ